MLQSIDLLSGSDVVLYLRTADIHDHRRVVVLDGRVDMLTEVVYPLVL